MNTEDSLSKAVELVKELDELKLAERAADYIQPMADNAEYYSECQLEDECCDDCSDECSDECCDDCSDECSDGCSDDCSDECDEYDSTLVQIAPDTYVQTRSVGLLLGLYQVVGPLLQGSREQIMKTLIYIITTRLTSEQVRALRIAIEGAVTVLELSVIVKDILKEVLTVLPRDIEEINPIIHNNIGILLKYYILCDD